MILPDDPPPDAVAVAHDATTSDTSI